MKLVLVGKIFDGEKIIDKGTIIVEDDKITKVLEGIEKVDNAKIIEGDFIMPGLVDAHMHFFGVEEDNVMAWNLVNEIDVAIRSTRDME
ncbi:amidohydrolase family protein, partial [Sulfolobus sp. B1]